MVTIEGTGIIDWQKEGNSYSLALPGGGFSPPERRQRYAEQDQSAPYFNAPSFSCHITTVRFPDDAGPANWAHSSTFRQDMFGQAYYRDFERREGTMRMIRGFQVEEHEIEPAQAQADNQCITDFDNSMGMIYYDPDEETRARTRAPVPATYELGSELINLALGGRG